MPEKGFDPKCYDLAELFLSDTSFSDPTLITELAVLIQQTIEDFIEEITEEHLQDVENKDE